MSGFEEVTGHPVWRDLAMPAKRHYDSSLPYHNWDHALEVAENACDLADRFAARGGKRLHPGVLATAGAWHDAGFAEDHDALGFETKEHYSAQLAADHLNECKRPPAFIEEVRTAILGTIHHAARDNLYALVLHRADIANIGGPYKPFMVSAYKLFMEARLRNSAVQFTSWRRSTGVFLGPLISESKEELPRLGEPICGVTAFPERAASNRRTLMLENEGSLRNKALQELSKA